MHFFLTCRSAARMIAFLMGRAACFGLLSLTLSGCFDVSHPFAHRGRQSALLVENLPPSRLAVPVPVPQNAPWRAATALWARDVVIALLGQSFPAVAQRPKPGDWWVRLGAVRDPAGIRPRYAIVDPSATVRAVGYGAVIDRAGWLQADPDALNTVALEIAPKIASDLTGIQAQIMQDNPQSLMNRPARIFFAGVHGAPGDGNIALGRSFYSFLPDGRNQLQDSAKNADYIVRTDVVLKDLPVSVAAPKEQDGKKPVTRPEIKSSGGRKTPALQTIAIIWHVQTPDGQEAGAATQLHEIEAHSLDGAWGDVASAAAQEAAGAVRTIITNYSGREHKPLSPEAQKQAALADKADVAGQVDPVSYIDGPDTGSENPGGRPLQMPPGLLPTATGP